MNEHLAFAQCLQRVLNETELTATEVARRLEMRSRNSIFRILKGKTSPQLNRRFLEIFHKHMGEQLTEAQWAALNRALEMDTVGEVEYKSRQALMQLVGAFSEPISPAKVCYLDALGAEKEDSFLHYLQVLFCGALKVNALLFGCCDLGLFRQLQEAIHPVAQRVIVRIDHFIYAGEDEIVSNLVGIQPMVDQPCYHAYLVDAENCPQERLAHYRTGQMTFHVMHQDGSESTVALFLLGKNEFTATVMSTQDLWMSRKVLCDRERFSPIRLLWQLNDENSDFIVYTQQYCKMEHGAAIYYIRPDVPFQYIPLEVLYPVVREGFARMGMTREEYEPECDGTGGNPSGADDEHDAPPPPDIHCAEQGGNGGVCPHRAAERPPALPAQFHAEGTQANPRCAGAAGARESVFPPLFCAGEAAVHHGRSRAV